MERTEKRDELYNELVSIYDKLRLMHYRMIFGQIKEREGSLSATEAYAVDVIHLLNSPTIKRFADYLGISQPNATYKVSSLISKGYVEKIPSDADRREYTLRLTDKFYRYYGEAHIAAADRAVEALRAGYRNEDLEKLSDMLKTLSASLD